MAKVSGRIAAGLLALTVVAGFAAPQQAVAGGAPLGYKLMCLQNPAECRGGGAARVAATGDQMALLRRVNAQVNSSIRPRNDNSGTDVWTVGASAGDCEDYAITKRHQLIRAGMPASSLRIAYVKTRWGEGHAVLVVKTGRGDLVLDNLTSAIKPLSQTGLRLISESGANPMSWS